MPLDSPQPRALALVGMPGAGKTLCAEHLAGRGFFTLRFGALVIGEVQRRGWDVSPANERIVREELRRKHGMAAMAVLSLPALQDALITHSHIVIDGLYSFSEYKLLSTELGAPLLLLAIVASRELRYRRLAERAVRPMTPAESRERDFREIEKLEKGGPIAIADYTLINDGAPADLLRRLDSLLKNLEFFP
ncbi:MAG: AAA family ATPase [Chloroflexi bacterium]|nr:AAA family ATPase [Chloroflexota bacterium]